MSRPSSSDTAGAVFGVAGLALILLAFLLSLALPAIEAGGGPAYSGWSVLRQGWEGARVGVPSWYANPLFAIAIAFGFAGRRATAGTLAMIGFVLALSSPFAGPLAGSFGLALPPLSLRAGFHLWWSAQLALVLWAWLPLAFRRAAHMPGKL